MAKALTFHGARAKLAFFDTVAGEFKVVGLFSSCSGGVTYDVQPIYILGRHSPAETVYTGQEAVAFTASGFRVVDNGPYVAGKVPKLQDLLQHEDLSVAILDRDTGKTIMQVFNCRPTGFQFAVSARAVTEITVNFIGLMVQDESGDQAEGAGGTSLTDGS
jgi:hypothetical protein